MIETVYRLQLHFELPRLSGEEGPAYMRRYAQLAETLTHAAAVTRPLTNRCEHRFGNHQEQRFTIEHEHFNALTDLEPVLHGIVSAGGGRITK